jgi:hypothetical protein
MAGIQSIPAAVSVSRQPPVDGYTVNTQSFGHKFRTLTFLNTIHRTLSQLSQGFMIKPSRICFLHEKDYTAVG